MQPYSYSKTSLSAREYKVVTRACVNAMVLLAVLCNLASEPRVSPITVVLTLVVLFRMLLPRVGGESYLWSLGIILVFLQIFYEYSFVDIPLKTMLTHAGLSLADRKSVV